MTKDKKGHVNDLSHVDKSHALSERVRINVGGCVYVTTKSTLMKHPNSLLAKLSTDDPNYDTKMEEYYFDRNHSIFEFVLEYYRTGFLHIPKGVCQVLVRTEFSFWGLDVNCIASCCLTDYHDHDMENAALKVIIIIIIIIIMIIIIIIIIMLIIIITIIIIVITIMIIIIIIVITIIIVIIILMTMMMMMRTIPLLLLVRRKNDSLTKKLRPFQLHYSNSQWTDNVVQMVNKIHFEYSTMS